MSAHQSDLSRLFRRQTRQPVYRSRCCGGGLPLLCAPGTGRSRGNRLGTLAMTRPRPMHALPLQPLGDECDPETVLRDCADVRMQTLVSPRHGNSRSRHADPQGDCGGMSLRSSSSRSRSRAAMNRECRPSYSSSTALALAVSWPKRRRVCMSSRCVRRNISDRATRSSARASSLGRSRGMETPYPDRVKSDVGPSRVADVGICRVSWLTGEAWTEFEALICGPSEPSGDSEGWVINGYEDFL